MAVCYNLNQSIFAVRRWCRRAATYRRFPTVSRYCRKPLEMLWFKSTSLHILTSLLKVFMPLSLMQTLHMHKTHYKIVNCILSNQDCFIIKSTHHLPHAMRMPWTWLNTSHANPVHKPEHIWGLMFLPLVLRRVGVKLVPGVLWAQKNKSMHSHPFVRYHIGSAPPTILSARHFFRTYSRNISDLKSNSDGNLCSLMAWWHIL